MRLDYKRFAAMFHAYFWLLFHIPMIIRKRKKVKALRKLNDSEVFKLLYPRSVALDYFIHGKKTYTDLMFSL
jgi:hypothetical protein